MLFTNILPQTYNRNTPKGGFFLKKQLFHGSDHIIETPIYGVGKKHNDYGQGFYCTEDIALAKEWAVSEEKDGYVNEYEIETNGLHILNIK